MGNLTTKVTVRTNLKILSHTPAFLLYVEIEYQKYAICKLSRSQLQVQHIAKLTTNHDKQIDEKVLKTCGRISLLSMTEIRQKTRDALCINIIIK